MRTSKFSEMLAGQPYVPCSGTHVSNRGLTAAEQASVVRAWSYLSAFRPVAGQGAKDVEIAERWGYQRPEMQISGRFFESATSAALDKKMERAAEAIRLGRPGAAAQVRRAVARAEREIDKYAFLCGRGLSPPDGLAFPPAHVRLVAPVVFVESGTLAHSSEDSVHVDRERSRP